MPKVLLPVVLLLLISANAAHAEGWAPGPGASGDDTYVGFIDQPAPGGGVSAPFEVRGWAVDQTAQGWSGIDQVQVFNGAMDQGGQLLATGIVGLDRPDVSDALGNPFFSASGFDAVVPAGALPPGPTTLNVYVHAPEKGWWQQQLSVQLQPQGSAPLQPQAQAQPQPVSRQFSDDPLIVVQAPVPDTIVDFDRQVLDVNGIAIDRNAPVNAGVGGSGVSHVTVYLDGGKRDGTFLGEATLGKTNRFGAGWGERFGTSGWAMQIHPNELDEDPHELYIYAASAVSPNESLVIVPFRIQDRR